MKGWIGILVVMLLLATAYAGTRHMPEDLAEQFIAAVNAKSREGQKALIHPRCFSNLSAVKKRFLDEALSRDFRRTIPENRTVKVTKLDNGVLPFGEMMVWPAKPTHQIQIEFSTAANSGTSIIRFIAKDKDQWFIIVPMLNNKYLKEWQKRNRSQPIAHQNKN